MSKSIINDFIMSNLDVFSITKDKEDISGFLIDIGKENQLNYLLELMSKTYRSNNSNTRKKFFIRSLGQSDTIYEVVKRQFLPRNLKGLLENYTECERDLLPFTARLNQNTYIKDMYDSISAKEVLSSDVIQKELDTFLSSQDTFIVDDPAVLNIQYSFRNAIAYEKEKFVVVKIVEEIHVEKGLRR